jgi:hypothetical protein
MAVVTLLARLPSVGLCEAWTDRLTTRVHDYAANVLGASLSRHLSPHASPLRRLRGCRAYLASDLSPDDGSPACGEVRGRWMSLITFNTSSAAASAAAVTLLPSPGLHSLTFHRTFSNIPVLPSARISPPSTHASRLHYSSSISSSYPC